MSENKRIVCVAVDDEPPALNVIQKHIALVPTLDLVASCHNAVEALGILQQHPVELLFLDIKMPKILGTDFVRSLKSPPKIIFTTAYRKFAVEGFELNAIDYLLKPISFERFLQAVSKVMDRTLHVTGHDPSAHYKKDTLEAFLYFRADRKMIKVALNDILYVESLKDYIKIFTPLKTIITKQSISSLHDMLPHDSFIRIHRSYLVAVNKIDSFNNERIEIARNELPISRMYKEGVRKILNDK
ncbi:MAG TPA: response regulator transcription factor, partial [Chryseolinea sp.]|nr:response regulator transcription factor [Chryseolinea sp.]